MFNASRCCNIKCSQSNDLACPINWNILLFSLGESLVLLSIPMQKPTTSPWVHFRGPRNHWLSRNLFRSKHDYPEGAGGGERSPKQASITHALAVNQYLKGTPKTANGSDSVQVQSDKPKTSEKSTTIETWQNLRAKKSKVKKTRNSCCTLEYCLLVMGLIILSATLALQIILVQHKLDEDRNWVSDLSWRVISMPTVLGTIALVQICLTYWEWNSQRFASFLLYVFIGLCAACICSSLTMEFLQRIRLIAEWEWFFVWSPSIVAVSMSLINFITIFLFKTLEENSRREFVEV